MRTFSIQTLGCKVNQYESEQIATLLRRHGLVQVDLPASADLRIINSCSVTIQAASKSRQTVRRATRLAVLSPSPGTPGEGRGEGSSHFRAADHPTRPRVIVTGCWATSDKRQAAELPGVDAVIGHHDNLAAELERLLESWDHGNHQPIQADRPTSGTNTTEPSPKPFGYEGSIKEAGASATKLSHDNKPPAPEAVKRNLSSARTTGPRSLPLLDAHQTTHQRALLKIQDGCDAHCTYCIIPQLRPSLWSKPIDDVVDEAQRMVDAGHREIVLTGIFLGAYGQPTAIRKRQGRTRIKPLAQLVEALCTRVLGLSRLRFSSLEPGDLTPDLLDVMRSYPQCVPHFHLPLQSGSDLLLRRMNRQYHRDDFLRMIDDVNASFDRPAITTDIILGFPGETDAEFHQTLDIVDRVKFIHIHAFHYSPRPGTAAARWTKDFIRSPVVNERINTLTQRAMQHSHTFRRQFLGETVQVLVERDPLSVMLSAAKHLNEPARAAPSADPSLALKMTEVTSRIADHKPPSPLRHGRCERYFDAHFEDEAAQPGDLVRVRIENVTPTRTTGGRVSCT